MVKIANLTSVEERLRAALVDYCFANGAKADEFSIAIFRHYLTGALLGEIVTDSFNNVEPSRRHKPLNDYLRNNLSSDDFKEIRSVYITPIGDYSTWEERNNEGAARTQFMRV